MRSRTILGCCVLLLATQVASAETIFYGPTPYLSAADSPFDLSGLGSTFWLEDFEDGELNTTGADGGLAGHPNAIRLPGPTTDSVDGDDGVIDGFGNEGRSLESFHEICFGFTCISYIGFEFDPVALGGYPQEVGIVVTDAFTSTLRPTSVAFIAYGRDGTELGSVIAPEFGDHTQLGETADDRFFGVSTSAGVSGILIEVSPLGAPFEVDHLQYGTIVPEPTTGCLLGLSLIAVFVRC